MAKLFTNSVVQPVMYQVRRDDTTGAMLYKRAPFEVVYVSGVPHVQPRGNSISDQSLRVLAVDTQEDREMWRQDSGYELLDAIVVNEHQIGDGSDTWIGLHLISHI